MIAQFKWLNRTAKFITPQALQIVFHSFQDLQINATELSPLAGLGIDSKVFRLLLVKICGFSISLSIMPIAHCSI